jgi:hypothetical protein
LLYVFLECCPFAWGELVFIKGFHCVKLWLVMQVQRLLSG